jgi:thiol-disulfide isomerase/thioredoxin
MTNDENNQSCQSCGSRRRMPFLYFALAIGIVALFFRKPITRGLAERALLSNDAPSEEKMQRGIEDSSDPQKFVLAEWNTGKIVPRELAIRHVGTLVPMNRPVPPALEEMLQAGALDPDENVREIALGMLSERHDPALPEISAAELADIDPQIRHLGLQSLRTMPEKVGLPIAVPLLDDPDPRIAGEVLNLMGFYSGKDFGVKLRDLPQADDPKPDKQEKPSEGIVKLRAGVKSAKAWLREHPFQGESARADVLGTNSTLRQSFLAPDFSLKSLDGKKVRLSDFRGKVVVLNFWTTWCTACIGETPELIKLQKLHPNDVVVLGTSLDFTPDDDAPDQSATPDSIKAKVARVARQRGMNYTVLLDETGITGGRYNGGELPTTIIIDANGFVRRRFVGSRDIAVFEALIAAASRPL